MSKTIIQWTATPDGNGNLISGYTFNPWWGCVKISDGCKNCYAEPFSKRFGHDVWGVNKPRHFNSESYWKKPLSWNAHAKKIGVRLKVFCASMSDVFEDNDDAIEARVNLFELIEKTPYLDWLLLTKRADKIKEFVPESWKNGDMVITPPNVWLGISAESSKWLSVRLDSFLDNIYAPVKFLSVEPQLEAIDLTDAFKSDNPINWVIFGGESGRNAREFIPYWAIEGIRQCRHHWVAPFVKQMGSVWAKLNNANNSKGGDINEWPIECQVREYPETSWLYKQIKGV